MIRVLIIDDHAIIREGLKLMLSETHDIAAVDEAANGEQGLDKVLKNDYDVILLDITMPGRGGIDALKDIHNVKPDIPILILSMHPEEQYALRVLKAGGSGYLTKQCAPQEVIDAIRKVVSGGKYISDSLTEELVREIGTDSEKPLIKRLSDREFQVFEMIASGKTVGKIAEELSLSVKTISTYRARILEKMNMKSNAELTFYAVSNKLVYF